ncbi:hypothetical protein BV22DRAFT_1037211 [Leucogyrophana mollusca]|uniref:Uncharacterized protein n=1 Tax=Leucogyrophana mollusca TaxID=85980 RepID=A0ACB8BA42_9AGAM|nr:hypothetical protein BV22DRAFT_1037211 [Leucogyrophana mollusca]
MLLPVAVGTDDPPPSCTPLSVGISTPLASQMRRTPSKSDVSILEDVGVRYTRATATNVRLHFTFTALTQRLPCSLYNHSTPTSAESSSKTRSRNQNEPDSPPEPGSNYH